jgi:hypothetical protein
MAELLLPFLVLIEFLRLGGNFLRWLDSIYLLWPVAAVAVVFEVRRRRRSP